MTYEQGVDFDAAVTYQDTYSETSASAGNTLNFLANTAGALASLALLAGVGYWGYKLMVRDVSGIPVVQAASGEMRVRPDDPGGLLARHQGLAVNAVAAEGGAAAPAERLILAPQPVQLTGEDMPMDAEAVAIVQQAIADQAGEAPVEDGAVAAVDPARVAEAAQSGSVDDLVAVLTEGITPLDAATDAAGPDVVLRTADLPQAAVIDAPGVRQSVRPRLRPARPQARIIQASATIADTLPATAPNPAALPAGTRLVQLGAYDDLNIAQVEWAKFSARFGDLMVGKERVVQEASSGGRTFYRLRAMGFDDLADARRFCSALTAEGADCIPVVTR